MPSLSTSVYAAMQAAIASPRSTAPEAARCVNPRTRRIPTATTTTAAAWPAEVSAPRKSRPAIRTSTGADPRATGYTTENS
jgi:hypothetical protein